MSRLRLTWHPNWRVTLLAALLLPVLLALGGWQLNRADEKAALQAAFEARQRAPAVQLTAAAEPADYTRVWLRGRFDNDHQFLLDNRMWRGQYGFQVLAPFVTAEGFEVLVNRGWIAGDPGRRTVPAVPPATGTTTVSGHVYRELSSPLATTAGVSSDGWPKVVQAATPAAVSALLGRPLPSFSVRIDGDAPGALAVDWPVINQSPAMHTGYAVQWFGLAVALVAAWLAASTNIAELIRGKRQSGN